MNIYRYSYYECYFNYHYNLKFIYLSTVRETAMQEMAAEKMRDVNSMQKKCSRDIETARTEERRAATKEIENIRKYFLDRESQTTGDLSQLEASHSDRVKRLENQLITYKKKASDAEDELDIVVRDMNKNAEGSKNVNGKYFKQLEEGARRADSLLVELKEAHTELQESRVREALFREQLARYTNTNTFI
jgi:hypothetical protein